MPCENLLIRNPAKEALKSGGAVVVFNVFEALRPSVVRIVAQLGYDLLLVETEHILHDPDYWLGPYEPPTLIRSVPSGRNSNLDAAMPSSNPFATKTSRTPVNRPPSRRPRANATVWAGSPSCIIALVYVR